MLDVKVFLVLLPCCLDVGLSILLDVDEWGKDGSALAEGVFLIYKLWCRSNGKLPFHRKDCFFPKVKKGAVFVDFCVEAR